MDGKLEERRQEALALMAQCTRLLQSRYGATRVIPFGSALGEGVWHERSDLDLAVEGLSAEALWQAEKELEAMMPSWLAVDLVPLERVAPEVRSRILGERSMPEDPYLALKARLEDELTGLERIAGGLEGALERAGEAPDEFATRALASYVDDFYKGCERLCERVAVTLDIGLPQGERRHQVWLGQMGEPGGGGRPPLFGGSLLLELDEYRRFRHRVRHIYGYELEATRVLALARGVASVFGRLRAAVVTFNRWIEGQAASGGPAQGLALARGRAGSMAG
jgi:predicted nucleotidyltransferase